MKVVAVVPVADAINVYLILVNYDEPVYYRLFFICKSNNF